MTMSPATVSIPTHDLLGAPLTESETHLFQAYELLKYLAAREDLPPCAEHNVRKALACLWQVTNDLNLQHDQLYQLGV